MCERSKGTSVPPSTKLGLSRKSAPCAWIMWPSNLGDTCELVTFGIVDCSARVSSRENLTACSSAATIMIGTRTSSTKPMSMPKNASPTLSPYERRWT